MKVGGVSETKKNEFFLYFSQLALPLHTQKKIMAYKIIAPNTLKTSILLPSSKSISNRVLILNALSNHSEEIKNISDCDDTKVVIRALRKKKHVIDIGAAGTAMRFLTAYLSGQNGRFTVTGTERMKSRPIKILIDALRSVGANIEYVEKDGFPPLRIEGKALKGGEVHLDGGVSSQYISALMMIAPTMTNGLRLHLTGNIISRPYINLTVQLMRKFGVIVFEEGQTFTIPPQQYSPAGNFTVESDWSAASYWYEMIALSENSAASVSLSGLLSDSVQGDASIVDFFNKLGVCTAFTSSGVTLTKKQQAVDDILIFDFLSMPDMAQTAAVTCAMLNIPFKFYGLQSLKIKETDRLCALQTELHKFGYVINIQNDNALEWNGQRCEAEASPVVTTYEDHRMAMAFAPISLCMKNGIKIADPEVVSKSYPSFWNDLKKAGFMIRSIDSDCCGQHDVCERDNLLAAARKKIEYYDDEELDTFRGIASCEYDEKAIEEFSEVLYTLREEEVAGWLRSLQLRNIYLPDKLKDEAFLIIEEQRKNK